MNEFRRKQGTRIGLSIAALAAAALFLTGVIGGKNVTYGLADQKSETEKGFGGEVTVHASLKGSTVRSLTVDTPDETDGLGKKASDEEFTSQFIGKEGPFVYGEDGIEAISGATVTSDAVLKALNRAVTGETAEALPAPEEPADTEEPAQPETAEALTAPEEPADTGEPAQPETGEQKAEEPAAAGAEAAAQGFGGDVTVHLELNEDRTVKSLTIDTPNETAGLGQKASEPEFTEQFIGKTGPFAYGENGIEALSGATITSDAVLKAINSTFGDETPAEQPAEAPAEEQPAETQTPSEELAEEQPAEAPSEEPAEEQPAEAPAEEPAEEQQAEAPAEEPAEEQPAEAAAEQPAEAPAAEQTPEVSADEPAAEQPAEASEEAPAPALYGSYLAEKKTDFSTIRVIVSTTGGKITGCRILSEGENDYLTDGIRTAWAKAIAETGTADNDAVTGATLKISAGAVKEAVAEIRQRIAGEVPAEVPAAEQPAGASGEEPAAEKPAEIPAEQSEAVPAEEPAEEQPAEAAAEQPAETPEEAPAPALYGSYLAERKTDFSTIRVIVSATGGKITGCRILSEGDNDYLTDEIRTAWAKAIAETGTADNDAVTGATLKISAGAVQDAVAEILEKIR